MSTMTSTAGPQLQQFTRGFASSVSSVLKNQKLFQQKAYVDGKWVDSVTNKSFEVVGKYKKRIVEERDTMHGVRKSEKRDRGSIVLI